MSVVPFSVDLVGGSGSSVLASVDRSGNLSFAQQRVVDAAQGTVSSTALAVGLGGTLSIAQGGTGATSAPAALASLGAQPLSGAWMAWSPTVTSTGGTLGTTTVDTATYVQIGKTVHYTLQITVTSIGTGSGLLAFTLPFNPLAKRFVCSGFNLGSGVGLVGVNTGQDFQMLLRTTANAFPVANGNTIVVSGTYEAV